MTGTPLKDEPTADCYAAGERLAMERYQRWRAYFLGPLLAALSGLGVRPDHLTFASLIFGLGFCPLYFWSPSLAFASLFMHLLLDGLDGPLARYQHTASRAGSFTDTVCDQVVVAATTAVMMPDPVPIWAGSAYIFLYTLVVAFAMVRNAMGIPYSWLLRPRIIVYLALAIETIWLSQTGWSGMLPYLLWAMNLVLGWKLLTGFWKLRRRLKRVGNDQS